MEAAIRIHENQSQSQSQRSPISPLNSPHSSSNNNNNNGVQIQTSRSDIINNNNPYPTTFVQADTSTFKQVVQMLTGSTTDTTTTTSSPKQQQDSPRNYSIPPIKNSPKRQQQQQNNSFKLYERRNSNLKNTLIINTLLPNFGNNINSSPRNNNKTELLSPSLLDFPKLTLSPVTPLNEDTFNNSSPSIGNSSSSSEEERAIAEKGFYLHPSPISTPRDSEPRLLSLFPVTSPKVSGSSF